MQTSTDLLERSVASVAKDAAIINTDQSAASVY
jgi:hypothetical protein